MAAPSPTVRLFLALWPPAAVRDACCAVRDAIAWRDGARTIDGAQLHLTLHFIGPVPRARVDALADALAIDGCGFDVALDRCDVWPSGIAAVEPSGIPAALAGLRAALGTRLVDQALPVESRAFRPHVTLARDARGTRPPATIEAIAWPVVDYVLVESAGGDYRTLRRYPLA